jgi:hypothetical protein
LKLLPQQLECPTDGGGELISEMDANLSSHKQQQQQHRSIDLINEQKENN